VTLFLAKKNRSRWQHLLYSERKKEDSLLPQSDPDEDPTSSIMKLMKKMYDEGDDEMKRTLAKSWYEAQHKKGDAMGPGLGGMGGMGGFGGMGDF
jgi:calcyclin binding protein